MATAALGSWPLWEKCNQHFVLDISLLTTPHTHIQLPFILHSLQHNVHYSFYQTLWCISRIDLNIFKEVCSFLKTIRTNSTTQWISYKSQLLNLLEVPSKWNVLVSLFTNKIVKMLNHVVNITVHTWCKLWQQFGWQLLLKCTKLRFLCMPYIHFKSTNVHITVCGILIERDCFKMFELLRIWLISQYLAAHFSHCNGPQ